MSRNAPDRPGTPALVAALNVRRNAALGFATGALLAVAAYLYRVVVVGQIPHAVDSPVLYVGLAFVLTFGVGALVTAALTARSAWRLATDQE